MKLFFLPLIVLTFNCFIYGQKAIDYVKTYAKHPKLEWSDFQVRPVTNIVLDSLKITTDSTAKNPAFINTRIDLKWAYNTENYTPNFSYEVNTFFYPATSWVFSDKMDDDLLEYLQGCYNITELHSRKLKKILSAYEVGRNIRKQMKNFHQQIESDRHKMQYLYHQQTNFSKNKLSQQLWNKKIDSLLSVFSSYK